MIAIRRANIPLTRLDPEAVDLHDAGDTLVVDLVASSLKLVCYASISVARQLVLDVLDDCNELVVAEIQSLCRRPVIVSAPREIDRYVGFGFVVEARAMEPVSVGISTIRAGSKPVPSPGYPLGLDTTLQASTI